MSLNIKVYNNEISPNILIDKNPLIKEMLQDLLKKSLDQRLIKLESSTNDHLSSLNYTSKYFKEFTKAIEQFSTFFVESEILKEKEKETIDKKESRESIKENNIINKQSYNKENYNSTNIISKKSNESGGSGGLPKNSSKFKQAKKLNFHQKLLEIIHRVHKNPNN